MYFIKEIFQKVAVSKALLVIVIVITESKASKDENEEQEESYIDARQEAQPEIEGDHVEITVCILHHWIIINPRIC